MQDFLNAGEAPPYLESVEGQIENRRQLRNLSVREYLRTAKIGYAELHVKIDIPLVNRIWKADSHYVVVGGAAHYIEAWDESNFSKYFFNSVKIAAITIVGQTVSSILAAYAFARIDFPGRNLLFSLFLATIFIPTMVVLIPNYRTVYNINRFFTDDFARLQDEWIKRDSIPDSVYERDTYRTDEEALYFQNTAEYFGLKDVRKAIADPLYEVVDALGMTDTLGLGKFLTIDKPITWKWIDNWPALVFPFLASTFSIFLLRQFFMQIPEDLWDAARIDGAGHFLFLFRVVVPISRAAIMTTIIFTFIGTWNALEWPILVTSTDAWRPISYGLYSFTTEAGTDPNKLMAGSVITLIPVLLLYLFAQKQFTEGIATTGLKG
ncbi:MAG: carbohydrate ABC transporter permease [Chloroflexi bacterium]|nr:carbohydrate ABC transporter permease [Chloroflexota bacterium]